MANLTRQKPQAEAISVKDFKRVQKPADFLHYFLTNSYFVHQRKISIPVREYRFHPRRKFRWDIAFVTEKLAIEVEGHLWSKGRERYAHAMPKSIMRDMEKNNLGVLLGWRLLRFTPEQIRKGQAHPQIFQALMGEPPAAGFML